MVPTIVPAATGNRAPRPSAIRTPEETPAAGPEHRHAVRLREQTKAQPRRQEVGDADDSSERQRADERPVQTLSCRML
jgi:hypothetical protein